MKSKTILLTVLALFAIASFSGCQYLKKRIDKTEKEEFKLNASNKIRIEVDNTNGNVDITSSDDTLNIIYVIAEKKGKVKINESDKPIEGIEIKIDTNGQVIRIETELHSDHSFLGDKNNNEVNYTIKVPAKFQVYVTLVNGTISADNIISDSKFENVNGAMYVKNCSGSLNMETVNGSIKANIDSTKGINAESVNGSITFGNLKNVNAVVEASCTNGKVKSENLNFSSLTSEKKSLTGKLGDGKNNIKLTTVNGSIKLDGNYISINKKEHGEFNFKWEFDDNDEPVNIKIEKTDEKQGIKEQAKDSNGIKEQPKK